MIWAWLLACDQSVDPEQPCLEVGYAIGARTEACEGDPALGQERVEAFESAYVCALPELAIPEEERDLYRCALIVRHLACELVLDYGDDFELWLASSPDCATILDPA
jgi:hypothetical protein